MDVMTSYSVDSLDRELNFGKDDDKIKVSDLIKAEDPIDIENKSPRKDFVR